MKAPLTKKDRFGLVRPAVDAHTLGISSVEQILRDCGYPCIVADAATCEAFGAPQDISSMAIISFWLRENRITYLGFSYRLDPDEGAALFGRLVRQLKEGRLLTAQGGPVKGLFFAGLPNTCWLVKTQNPDVAGVFCGDETPAETLRILGIAPGSFPSELARGMAYDEARLAFGRDLVRKGEYLGTMPLGRTGYDGFGTRRDTLVARIRHGIENRFPPVMRAHVGPYLPDRKEAVRLFLAWARRLARSGFLDVLSIGTSQLTQSAFGEDWGDRPNGGGVPLNSPEEYAAVWEAAHPMLVRTYAGTHHIPALARMHEETINIAWHALSLWWFCRIDGRGPYDVRENLQQHVETLKYIATTGKPFEANVPHHFAFRGADDVTYVVSAVLAARLAKTMGIRHFVLQNMLNTPKYTWGVQDLAKSRAMLTLVRELEDERFHIFLQPRGGLAYFSHDLAKAKAQLAAVSALMDDIEPRNPASPEVVHVVSYSEAAHLADPNVVDESIQITRHAIWEYRRLRAKGDIDDMTDHPEVAARTGELLSDARTVLRSIESAVPNTYTAEGLYQILARGYLPVPYLWECREEFQAATRWPTRLVRGSVKVVDEQGNPIPAEKRMGFLATVVPPHASKGSLLL
ncbi:MAG TPA: cobalamin-binding protein [Phycisphaerae bacterium]|nr:cobalamin-binding protein [Phycisphaerae bacterium]